MENFLFHPVYIEKKKSAQLVSAQSQEIKDMLRKRREEDLAIKRALIQARRHKVIPAPADIEEELHNDVNQIRKEISLDEVSIDHSTNIKQETSPLKSDLKNVGQLIESEKLDLKDEENGESWNIKFLEENLKQNDYKFYLEEDKIRKKRSRKWLKYRKNIFDNASSVYLESKNLKDFIRIRKEEDLAKKRAKVNARRQTLTLAKNKHQHGIWLSRNSFKQEDQTQRAYEDRQFPEIEEGPLDDIEDDYLSDVHSSSDKDADLNIYNSSEDEEENYDDDKYYHTNNKINNKTLSHKKELCQCKKNVCRHPNLSLKSGETYNFSEMEKEICNAYIALKACENIIVPDISMKMHAQRDSIQRQRQSRRSSLAELRRRRSETAQSLRRQMRSVEVMTRQVREHEAQEKRTVAGVIKKSRPSVKAGTNPKPSRWTLERANLEREFEIRLQQEKIMLMQKLIYK